MVTPSHLCWSHLVSSPSGYNCGSALRAPTGGRKPPLKPSASAKILSRAASRKYANSRPGSNCLVIRSGMEGKDVASGGINFQDPLPHPHVPHIRNAEDTNRFTPLRNKRNHAFGKHVAAQFGRIAQSHLDILSVLVTEINQVGPHRLRLGDSVPILVVVGLHKVGGHHQSRFLIAAGKGRGESADIV